MTSDEYAARGLLFSVEGGLATVTLNRPETRNAQTPALWDALREIADSIPDHVRVVVVRAEYPTRYARNGPFFDRPVLYVSAPATTSLDAAAEAFPGRPLYEAHEGKQWTIARVR